MAWDEYQTKIDDVLDAVCYAYFGAEGHTENVLTANPHLVQYALHLPAGVTIKLTPKPSTVRRVQVVSLWD